VCFGAYVDCPPTRGPYTIDNIRCLREWNQSVQASWGILIFPPKNLRALPCGFPIEQESNPPNSFPYWLAYSAESAGKGYQRRRSSGATELKMTSKTARTASGSFLIVCM
jgi:hypothetical protein